MNLETAVVTRDPTIWEERAYVLIRGEMRRRKISFKKLSARLVELGVRENPDQVARKLNRKRFSAAFMLACLTALGVDAVTMAFVLKLGTETQPRRARTQK